MKPDRRFQNRDWSFWAYVKAISAHSRYMHTHTPQTLMTAIRRFNCDSDLVVKEDASLTELGESLKEYFDYRTDALNNHIEPQLMDVDEAKKLYLKLSKRNTRARSATMNKQSGRKKRPAYFTNIINFLIEDSCGGIPFVRDPKQLSVLTQNGRPAFVFSRRLDGAFPTLNDPIALWEIKEYYYTTTFGSRVADGVYESQLDGFEVMKAVEIGLPRVSHYIFVDSRRTFWEMGKSYLCRFIDMLHMGFADEILFGREVLDRLPSLAKEWCELERTRRI